MIDATGGTITYSSGKTIHTFTSSGTFVVPSDVVGIPTVEVLVVGGGGGGGAFGGGGGAGGVVYKDSYALSSGNYSVVVGSGGAGQPTYRSSNPGSNGGNSSFGELTAFGGGGGGTRNPSPYYGNPGIAGGSGGGASPSDSTSYGAGGAGFSGQGNNGGEGGRYSWGGGGGGGAGGVGGNSTEPNPSVAGNGGVGVAYSISGTSTYYGGGGGGCNHTGGTAGSGGNGGGGNGAITANGGDATANTGGGGGGGGAGAYRGGNGGSGIVIISYETNQIGKPVESTNFLKKYRRARNLGLISAAGERIFPTSGLTNFWKFESNLNDEVGGNTGTGSGIVYASGKQGNGLSIDATTDYVSITPITHSTITIAGWYYYGTANTGSWNTVFCRNGGTYHHVLINGDTKLIGFYNSAWYPSNFVMETGNWYFIVCEKTGTNEKIYINNNLVLDSNSSFDNSTSGGFGIIGNYHSTTPSQGARGTIDEVGVWNRALTSEEKRYLYSLGDGVYFNN